MSKIINKNSTKEELINALIDLFNMREAIEAYLDWLERPCEDLLFIYNCQMERINGFDPFDDCGDFYHG